MKASLLSTLAIVMISTSASAQELIPPRGKSVEALLALQSSDFSTTMTTTLGEQQLRALEMAELERKLALPPGEEATKELPGAMWTSLLFNTHFDRSREVLLEYLPNLEQMPPRFQQFLLYMAHHLIEVDGIVDEELLEGLIALLNRVHGEAPSRMEDREYAIASYTFLRAMPFFSATQQEQHRRWLYTHLTMLRRNVTTVELSEEFDPRLEALRDELARPRVERVKDRPPLVDLLAHPFAPGKPVLFSLQRTDRRHPGIAIIRGADGRFHRDATEGIFSLQQLANARTNLPGTITNGNTPQGLFTIIGTGTAQNKWIGPTTYLWSQIPVEASVAEFRHHRTDESWSRDLYTSFLPASWREYIPMHEAWLAGRAGRSEMICHGTTINPDYYIGQPYHPFTPSAGCLVTHEEWDKTTGVLTRSDQLTLLQEFVRAGGPRGYLVVVELDNAARPVTLDDVMADLKAAEAVIAAGE